MEQVPLRSSIQMTRTHNERAIRLLIIATIGIIAASSASAAEICVTCSEPDAKYLCSLEKEKNLRLFYKKDDLYEKVCTSLLPKLGGHKHCVAEPKEAPCPGVRKVIMMKDALNVIVGK